MKKTVKIFAIILLAMTLIAFSTNVFVAPLAPLSSTDTLP